MTTKIYVDHEGITYFAQVATVKRTKLGKEDHGILTAWLMVEGHGWGVGVGGYALDEYDKEQKKRVPMGYGLDFIVKLIETVGAGTWEDLPGRRLLVLYDGEDTWGKTPKGIAHLQDEDKVFVFGEHAAKWRVGE